MPELFQILAVSSLVQIGCMVASAGVGIILINIVSNRQKLMMMAVILAIAGGILAHIWFDWLATFIRYLEVVAMLKGAADYLFTASIFLATYAAILIALEKLVSKRSPSTPPGFRYDPAVLGLAISLGLALHMFAIGYLFAPFLLSSGDAYVLELYRMMLHDIPLGFALGIVFGSSRRHTAIYLCMLLIVALAVINSSAYAVFAYFEYTIDPNLFYLTAAAASAFMFFTIFNVNLAAYASATNKMVFWAALTGGFVITTAAIYPLIATGFAHLELVPAIPVK